MAGKNVLITGGGRGIGKAIAFAFALAGVSTIVLVGRTESSLLATRKELLESARHRKAYPIMTDLQVITHVLDVSNNQLVKTVFKTIQREVGGTVDVLVSNAGYLPDFGLIADTDFREWWSGFEINLAGYFNVVQAYLKSPLSLTGHIISINSAAGHLRYDGMSSYSGAKNAALWLTDSVCEEYPNVFAVSMHPGVCETEMNAKNAGVPEEDINLPAHLAVWLTSPEGNFLRGRMIWSSWDVEEMMDRKQEILDGDLLRMTLRGYPISRGLGYSTDT
ncbi:uncharacterized protein PV07_04617 [Cladophialophora immunda]|uniref:Uncharacterized protein n=1 Tax=Cladophialophora immunda TaxID=569365 RepID=A0A0D1ZYF0_9EURO|nr:uncharacterized protein PV07_04617 [Cladophialophora immunda]KIW33126.1 hypothetical protein PV07_04617 [Cladophialophora immunda]